VIEAEENLAEASWSIGRGPRKPLSQFKEGESKTFTIRQTLDLEPEPGLHDLHLWAKTRQGLEQQTDLKIFYLPRVPGLKLKAPKADIIRYEGEDAPSVALEASIAPCPWEYEAVIVLDGKESAVPVQLDRPSGQLTALVPLHPGENRLQVKLYHSWGEATFPDAQHTPVVGYKQLPYGFSFVSPEKTLRPLTALLGWPSGATPSGMPQVSREPLLGRVDVRIHSTLPLKTASALVGGRRGSKPLLAVPDPNPTVAGLWTVHLDKVPLDPGLNVLQVKAANEQGECRQPGNWLILYVPPPKPPESPIVQWEKPERDDQVSHSRYKVQIRVNSVTRLERVEIRREGERKALRTLTGTDLPKTNLIEETVRLNPGINELYVVAVNAGGERRAPAQGSLRINYVPQPVEVVIEKLEAQDTPGRFFPATYGANRRIAIQGTPQGKVWLHGKVRWSDADDERLDLPASIKFSVNRNDVNPQPLEPRPASGRERAFRVALDLTQETDNEISFGLLGLEPGRDVIDNFTVSCTDPVPQRWRLHLLIVDPQANPEDQQQLRERVLKTLGARKEEKWSKALGFEVDAHATLVGANATARTVNSAINAIKAKLLRAEKAHSFDVVLVYYNGEESEWLKITEDCLAERFENVRGGGRVLLLDVLRDQTARAKQRVAQLSDQCGVGVFCYAWMEQAGVKQRPLLLDDLTKAMRGVSNWGQVDAHLKQEFLWDPGVQEGRSPKYKSLRFDHNLPDGVKNLPIFLQP
jgi:hypothetical protein